jgi:hypothetical protein
MVSINVEEKKPTLTSPATKANVELFTDRPYERSIVREREIV